MSWLRTIVREVFGLFVDDGSFALLILLWVGLAAFALPHFGLPPRWMGLTLFFGLALILASSAIRYKRSRRG